MASSAPISEKNFPWTYQLTLLLAAGCLTVMTGSIVAPVFPEMVQQLQLDPKWAGLLLSMHSLTIAISTPLLGMVADRVGKIPVLVLGLLGYAVFGVAAVFIDSMPLLLITRGLLGIASGGITAASIGLLGSLYDGEARSRILGYATAAMTAFSIVFPLLGGWLGQLGWTYAFYLYGLGLPLAVVILVSFNEPSFSSAAAVKTDQLQHLLYHLRRVELLKQYLLLLLTAILINAVVIYAPIYLKQAINAGSDFNGLVLALRAAAAAVISALAASQLARKIGIHRAVAIGFFLMAIALFTLPWLVQVPLILLTAAVFGTGLGIILPNLFDEIASLAPSDLKTSILAIATGFKSLGHFASPLCLGLLWNYVNLASVFYAAAGLAIAAGCLSLQQFQTKDSHTHL
jgi:MFS transporter, ACDE family, multidrug resistance protein